MKRSIQEIVELLVFGLIAVLIGTALLWVVGWAIGGLGALFKLIAGLIWSLLRFIVPIAVVGAAVYALVRLLQGPRREAAATSTTAPGTTATGTTGTGTTTPGSTTGHGAPGTSPATGGTAAGAGSTTGDGAASGTASTTGTPTTGTSTSSTSTPDTAAPSSAPPSGTTSAEAPDAPTPPVDPTAPAQHTRQYSAPDAPPADVPGVDPATGPAGDEDDGGRHDLHDDRQDERTRRADGAATEDATHGEPEHGQDHRSDIGDEDDRR